MEASSVLDTSGAVDTFDEEGDSFLPPPRVLDRMKIGASLLKVNESGKARKRHFQVSKDQKALLWLPSKKRDSEFVNFDNVLQVVLGTESPALAKLKANSKVTSEFFSRPSSSASVPGTVFHSGFLFKKGGSKGGRRNWTRRWHVLDGSTVNYYKNPKDTTPKGTFSVIGAAPAAVLDSKYSFCFEIKLQGGETRLFRADSRPEMDDWMSKLKRAALLSPTAAAGAPAPSTPPKAGTSSAEEPEKSLEDILDMSFSLVGKPGTMSLHVVCGSKEECEFWFRGIQGLVAYQQASVEASIHVYQEAVDRNPNDVMSQISVGLALLRQDRLSEALSHLSKAVELAPASAEANRSLSRALDKAGRLDEAIVHASKAAQLRSRDPEFHILLGSLYVKTGNVTDAIAAYQQALIADPSLKEAHVRLADLFSSIGREDDAKRHYQEALRVDPSYKWAHVNLGLSLERQGNVGEAIDHYNSALKIDANFLLALFNLGQAHERLGNPVESDKIYEKCLLLQPSNVRQRWLVDGITLSLLGICRGLRQLSFNPFLTQVAFIRMESRIDEALPLFEKAASIARTGPTFLNYGMALEASVFGLGRDDSSFNAPPTWPAALDTALEQYRAALMSQPGFDQARYALARLLKRKGCDEEAAVELKELQRRSPAFPVPPALSAALEPWMAATSTLYATGMAPVLSRKASNAVVAASSSPPKVSTLAAVAETPEVVDTPVEAAAALTDTVEPGSVAEDVIGDAVDETGDAGGSDSETEGTIESARTAEASLAFSTALPVFDFKGSRMFSSAPLSAEERQREFIAAMKRDKEAAEAEAARKKQDEFERLTEEEKDKRRQEEALTQKHESKKEKMLSSQMKAYSKSGAALLAGSGRGRGRGGKK